MTGNRPITMDPRVVPLAKVTERASWPGMLLTQSEWQTFDAMDGDEKRTFYRWWTRE